MVKPWSSVRIDSGSCKRGPDIIGNPTITRVEGVKRPERVMINQNHPTNELINVIQKKYNECAVGFLVNTSV